VISVRLRSTGRALPGLPVTNDDLVARGIPTSDAWIRERTGILSRHLAPEGALTADLAVEAGQSALVKAGLNASDIDLLILATSTPDFVFPSTASLVQARLGIDNGSPAFDVQAVCSGFVYALTIAEKFLKSGSHQRALVIGAELFSRLLDWDDRGTCVLFGDGAGAFILETAEAPGLLSSALHADGRHHGILSVPGRVSGGQVVGDPFLRMDGQAVFKFAVRVLAEVAHEVIEKAGVRPESIDWLIPHQANIRILQATAKRLGLPMEKVITTLTEHGNTSAASIPLALDTALERGQIAQGQRVLLEGVGGGFTWGAVLMDL
jgi:3-oxoacyl-[acyl-carrier-protein] synthase III